MTKLESQTEFIDIIHRHHGTARDAFDLMRIARALNKINLRLCNEDMSDAEYDRIKAREAKLEADAALIAKEFGVTIIPGSGDPRGFSLKLKLPDGRYNSFGGAEEGWGIPT